jgi:hypothetical protein
VSAMAGSTTSSGAISDEQRTRQRHARTRVRLLAEWLADPEIGMRQGRYYALVESWRELIVLRGVDLDCNRLQNLDESKVRVVLPAVRKKSVLLEHRLTAEPVPIFTLPREHLRTRSQT